MNEPILVGVIMGSKSDWDTMMHAGEMLTKFNVSHECRVVSAHRTPDLLTEYALAAESRGLEVIIAGAGGAAPASPAGGADRPGAVLGVPIESHALKGMDSLLSIVQMPNGVPVATVAVNAAKNAGILAAQILGASDPGIRERVLEYKRELEREVLDKAAKI